MTTVPLTAALRILVVTAQRAAVAWVIHGHWAAGDKLSLAHASTETLSRVRTLCDRRDHSVLSFITGACAVEPLVMTRS